MYGVHSNYSFAFGEAITPGFAPLSLGNSALKWETTLSRNLGLDFGILNNRISGSIDIYKNSTTNRWGSSGTERRDSTEGTLGSDGLTRTFNYTAKVLTTQATPAVAGDYTDTLTVDIAF